MRERIEAKWIAAFRQMFELCRVSPGETVAIYSETLSRQVNVHLAELALVDLGAKAFHVVSPTPPQRVAIPVRSTGWSDAVQHVGPVINALRDSSLVVDLSVEGLLHSQELPQIMARGNRVLYVSNEHPEALERLMPDPAMKERIRRGAALLSAASSMHVTSPAGTDLIIDVSGAEGSSGWGFADEPGHLDTWPGGLVSCFPGSGAVNGRLVLACGDINLTFKRYLERPITLHFENDYITGIEGEGVDADLFRSYIAGWGDREAYASAHVGWGMNQRARWDALVMYDKSDTNGTEQRAFAGNFLFSTGVNPQAGRTTRGHFDLPLRHCTICLDGRAVVESGRLSDGWA